MDVQYALDMPGFPAGLTKLRCLIMNCTGDYPAQCEIGKFINGGKMGCRRDKLKGFCYFFIFFFFTFYSMQLSAAFF